MNLCGDRHDVIAFEGDGLDECPACKVIKKFEAIIMQFDQKVSDLEKQIDDRNI